MSSLTSSPAEVVPFRDAPPQTKAARQGLSLSVPPGGAVWQLDPSRPCRKKFAAVSLWKSSKVRESFVTNVNRTP